MKSGQFARRRRLHFILGAVAGLSPATIAAADTFEWTNPANGFFSTPANWTLLSGATAAPPGVGDLALFNEFGAYTVTFNANAASDLLEVTHSTVTFISSGGQRLYDLSGGVSDLNVLSGTLSLGTGFGNGLTINTDDMTVRGGGTMNVRFSDVSTSSLSIANASNGTIVVDGIGSTLNSGTVSMGLNGAAASLTYQNSATGTFTGSLNMAVSGVNNTAATLNVNTGSSLTTGAVNMMTFGGPTGQSALLELDGALTISGASTLTMGSASADASTEARINLFSSGVLNTGTGNINVNKQGVIANSGGDFNANGNITFTAGRYEENSGTGATFNLAAGRTLTVQGGGDFLADQASFNGNTVIVDGPGTSFSLTGTTAFSSDVGVSTSVTLRNSATASFGTLSLGNGFESTGDLTVENNATLTTGSITMGTGASGASGNINLAGGSITQTGSSGLTIGGFGGGTSTLSITGGSFVTGTGLLAINPSGVLSINGPASFTPNGDLTVTGGTFNHLAGSIPGAPDNITIRSNGQFNINSSWSAPAASTYTVQSGGDFSVATELVFSSGSFVVEGSGSTLSVGDIGFIGGSGGTGVLNIRNSGQATLDRAMISTSSGSSGTLLVEAGGDATITFLDIATGNGTGTVTVTGVGSTLTLPGFSSMTIGAPSTGSATLDVNSGAVLNQAITGSTLLRAQGTLDITDATVNLGSFTSGGGTINFNSGTFTYVGDLTVGVGGLLGSNLTLSASHTLGLTGTTTIDPNHTLQLSGGRLITGDLVNNGSFDFIKGRLDINSNDGFTVGSGGPLGSAPTLGSGQALHVFHAATVDPGASLTVNGGSFSAASLTNAGTVVADGGTLAVAGTINNQSSGLLAVAENQLLDTAGAIANAGEIQLQGLAARITGAGAITNTGLIRGDGRIGKPVNNGTTGEVRVESGDRLAFQGTFAGNAGRITLLGGTAEFTGSALTNGASGLISGRGTLMAPLGLTNDGQISLSADLTDVFAALTNNSTGKVFVTGGGTSTFYSPLTLNSGGEFRVSAGSTAVFLDNVTGFGAGSFTGSGTKIFESGMINVSSIATSTGKTIVEAPASVTTGHVREASLTVNGLVTITPDGTAAGMSTFNVLSIDSNGQLELNDNDLIVDYTGASVEDQVRGWVVAGLGGGTGITTLAGDGDTVLAVAEQNEWGQTNFNGFEIDDTTIIGKYTYYGDANLDGTVTSDDYVAVDVGIGVGDSWVEGDFDMSGDVTSDDYVATDVNLGKGSPNPLAFAELKAEMIALHTAMFGEGYVEKLAYAEANGFGATVVPEPAGGMLLAAGVVGLAGRRRKTA